MASNQPAGQPPKQSLASWLLLIVVAVIAGPLLVAALNRKNNQVAPLLPGPPAPVVPALPNLAASLADGKSMCEGRAAEVKAAAKAGRIRAQDLGRGRGLYTEAKAASDGCILYLKAGLARRFDEDDPKTVRTRMDDANRRMMEFLLWADQQLRPQQVGAVGPWGEALDAITGWVKAVQGQNEQNDRALAMLRDDLESCRLRDWDEVGDRPVAVPASGPAEK